MSEEPPIIVNAQRRGQDDLTLVIDGTEYGGWEDIEVTLRAEGFPNSFEIKASKPPATATSIAEGNPCEVLLGNDRVVSGYVDRVMHSGDADTHSIQVLGRGKTQDLVDCGAEWPSHQLIGGNAQTIATRLASAYGVTVVMLNGASPGADVAQWPLNYGETGAEIIQRLARAAGLLAYETSEGKLALASVGTAEAASGIRYGENVQAWSLTKSMDQRFSDYVCCSESMDAMMDLAGSDFFFKATDANVPRHRLTYLVVENVASDPQAFTIQRAKWEASRRAGRAFVVRATIDSWRDSKGTIWAPNTILPVKLPAMDAEEKLVISEIIFRRSNEGGTTADLMCMRKEAFTPEPITLVPVNLADVNTVGQ